MGIPPLVGAWGHPPDTFLYFSLAGGEQADRRHEGAKLSKPGLIGLALVAVLAGCGPGGPGGVASDTARAWTENQTERAALDATQTLLSEFPLLRTIDEAEVEDAVREAFHWSLSSPVSGDNENQYRIKIKASSRPKISVPNMTPRAYEISLDYELTVDSVRRVVVGYVVDVSGMKITDRSDLVAER